MSSVASSAAAPTASGISCSVSDFTQFPSQDVGCTVGSISGLPDNTTDAMKDCCKADPTSFANDCGLFCLAYEQSVGDLQKCFTDKGILSNNIYCNSQQTATATGKPEKTNSPTSSGSGAASTTGGNSQESTGAAVAMMPPQNVSKAGLGMLAMIVVSAFAGAAIL